MRWTGSGLVKVAGLKRFIENDHGLSKKPRRERTDKQLADLIQGLDGPRTAQQELFYDLEDATAIIGWSATELSSMAGRGKSPEEAITLSKISALLKDQQAIISLYADEVKAGRIVRSKAE